MLYMTSSFWLLGVESRDFSQAERERTACKAEQIHKITPIFSQNNNLALKGVLSFSEKSRNSTPNSQKLEAM